MDEKPVAAPASLCYGDGGRHPRSLWLRVDGCCNGPVRVVVKLSANSIMYFTCGWKFFICARYLGQGHLLNFKLVKSDMLVVKFFGDLGSCMEYCTERSSNSDTASSSESHEEDEDDDDAMGIQASKSRTMAPTPAGRQQHHHMACQKRVGPCLGAPFSMCCTRCKPWGKRAKKTLSNTL